MPGILRPQDQFHYDVINEIVCKFNLRFLRKLRSYVPKQVQGEKFACVLFQTNTKPSGMYGLTKYVIFTLCVGV